MLVIFNLDATTQFFSSQPRWSLYVSLYGGHKAICERLITFLFITLSVTTCLSPWPSQARFLRSQLNCLFCPNIYHVHFFIPGFSLLFLRMPLSLISVFCNPDIILDSIQSLFILCTTHSH